MADQPLGPEPPFLQREIFLYNLMLKTGSGKTDFRKRLEEIKSMFKISSSGLKWRLLPLDCGFFSARLQRGALYPTLRGAIPFEKPFVQSQNPSI